MKKYLTLSILVFLLTFISCEKEKVKSCECTEDGNEILENTVSEENCEHYFDIWKALLLKRNNISEEYYNSHFKILKKGLNNYNDGTQFRVQYEYKNNWVNFTNSDMFIIQINDNITIYPHIKVNRGNLLSSEEIEKVIEGYGFNSSISVLDPNAKNNFKSEKETLNYIENELGVSKINATGFKLYNLGPVTKPNGTIFMKFGKTIDYDKNKCLYGEVNLASGGITSSIDACYVD